MYGNGSNFTICVFQFRTYGECLIRKIETFLQFFSSSQPELWDSMKQVSIGNIHTRILRYLSFFPYYSLWIIGFWQQWINKYYFFFSFSFGVFALLPFFSFAFIYPVGHLMSSAYIAGQPPTGFDSSQSLQPQGSISEGACEVCLICFLPKLLPCGVIIFFLAL